jgi:hypothetical protein
MRHYQVLVLIYFVRVFGTKARFGRKRKLRHAVVKLLLGGCYFSRDARVSLNSVVVVGLA